MTMNLESHAMTAETPSPRAVPVSLEVQRTVEAAFRHYESRLFHAALRITHNEDDAWDAVQEGMVNALRNAERFRGDAAVASWLYSIVVNAALYQRRRAAARRRGVDKYEERVWPEAECSLEAGSTHRDPETYVLARVELQRVMTLIDALPADKRALVAQSLEGDSCSEIAEGVGLPLAAVKSKLWRTRVALRTQMGEGLAAAA
jgi:RNA polymerase sigma-70 factor (ECF subfamily)